MFCGLGEECTRLTKKKKEKKKQKNLITAKSVLVGMKGYLKTYKHENYVLPYISRFERDRFLRQTFEAIFGS